MEGASASNVSHAADTRVMDSADEEPVTCYLSETDEEPETSDVSETDEERELPSAVQDLLLRLEGEGAPITTLPHSRNKDFRKFFPKIASLSTMTGWRSQVRLRVLEAIGNCNTFESLDVDIICGGDISRLTESEWEVVFRGFKSSTVLETISLWDLEWSSDAEVESLCSQIGRMLNSSSVKKLRIVGTNLSARCWLNLASGLRGNPDSKLQSLDLYCAWEDSSAVKHVADIINSATRLETLRLRSIGDMEEETVGILSQALIQSSSLKVLALNRVKWGEALLLNALARDDGNRSIERLELERMDGLGGCLREVLTSNPSLKEVVLDNLRMSSEEWHRLGEFIRDNATATNTRVEVSDFGDERESIEALACAASSDVKDPTVELVLSFLDEEELMLSLNLLGRVLRGEIKSLKSFSISQDMTFLPNLGFLFTNQGRPESFLSTNEKTGETSVLHRLRLYVYNQDVWKEVWKDLVGWLQGNTSLTHLDLSGNTLHEEAFREMMGVLQVNLTLQEIDVSNTTWATDGKAALIQESLQQNQKRAVYRTVFTEAGLALGDAKAGRLFLCGSPLAGKTQLRNTLMKIVQGESWLRNKLSNLRTTGIEVEFLEYLQHNERRQISIWDLAGQEIFRTLQNVLFPRTSNFFLFLFVYNPFCEKTSSNKEDSCFQTELEDWMSFISSNIKVDGHNRPQVLVVISHKDKSKIISVTWAESIVNKLSKPFAEYVDIHPIQECFHVNARKKKQVIPLKNHIFEIFTKLWSEKFPQVPTLCSQLSSRLVTNTKKNRNCPLWRIQNFHKFCAPTFKEFIPSYFVHTDDPSSSVHTDDHSRITNSMISYLNDIGSIVHIPKLDYIIVDPNWLTNTLLGKLVALGQNFQAQKTGCCRNNSYTQGGFVSDSVFTGLIKEFLRKQPQRQRGVNKEAIEGILISLDLCFKEEDTSQYFIPSFIPENASMEEQKLAWGNRNMKSEFVGIRIQCKDERTMSLTAAFFPCFQVTCS
ncbi:hypothetical protein MPTK1_3g20530 [Marchantia polymorpha subsp. ruderalis]